MAVDYRGITIEIDGETSKLSAKLRQINDDAKYAYSGLRDVNNALKFDDSNVTLLSQKQKYLAEAIELTKQRIDAYQAGMEALSQTAADNGSLTREQNAQYDQLERGVLKCEQQIKSYETTLAELSKTEQENIQDTEALAEEHAGLSERLTTMGERVRAIGDAATVGITAPLVAGAKTAVDAAVSIDSALTDVKKTVDGTEEDYQRLKDAAIAASEVQPVSAAETLQIEALGAQLGFAIDELEEFGSVASGMDIATNMDAEQASTEMAQFANITGMAHDKISNYASTIIALGNSLSTTESSVSSMAQRIAAAGNQIGLTEADTLGLAAALTSLGINAEEGGSNISKIMSQIDKDVATSSDGVQAWAEAAGMSAEAFAQAWQSDPVSALQAVFAGMQTATTEGSNLSVMLDDLGIKSNAAVDVAKRLTSGHETLANAIEIANNAWRENTALADEVANRNESLESKFQILQNRVQNMLAEVGEPLANALIELVDAADPVIDAVAGLADGFASLPEPIQQAIVSAGAMVAAFGPITSIVGRVVEVSGGLAPKFGEVKDALGLFCEGFLEGEGVIGSFTTVVGSLSDGLKNGLVGIGIALAVKAIGAIIDQLDKWRQHQEDVIDATTGLTTAMGAMDEAAAKYNDSIDDAAKHTTSLKDRIEEVVTKQAELARSMREDWAEIGTDNATLERYVAQIEELGKKGKLSAEDMAVLNNAIEQVNSITGANISTLEDANGTLALNAEQVREIAEAWEQQEQVTQHQQDYNDLLERQAEAHAALDDAMANTAQATSDLGGDVERYLKTLGTAPSTTGMVNQSLDELRQSANEADEAVERAREGMAQTEYTFSTVEAALVSAGTSIDDLASLTDAQMAAIRKAFDGTASSAVKALEQIRSAAREAASASGGATSSTPTTSINPTETVEYKNLKAKNDAVYKEKERAYSAEYKALQKHLASEEDAMSKAHSAAYESASKAAQSEYDQLRKSLQSQYDLRKSELDKIRAAQKDAYGKQIEELRKSLQEEYDVQKSEMDKSFSEYKKVLDNRVAEASKAYASELDALRESLDGQVEAQRKANDQMVEELRSRHESERDALSKALSDAASAQQKANSKQVSDLKAQNSATRAELKKSLDAQYSDRSKAAQKEAKQWQKENQKILKDAKATYSAQTKAFRDETSARIAAIKEEYEAKKRYVEENDGTAGIDAQIASLKAEAKAEEDAAKQRERAEKTAELRLAVEQAKTRRTKADAEKALSDYLDQLAEEDRKAERERLIESLEDQKSSIKEQTKLKQDALDAERDQLIASYQERRELELEQLQATNDALYEALSESLSDQLELRRERQQEELSVYRESLDSQLQALADKHAAEEEALSESLAEQLEQIRESNQRQLDAMDEMHEAEEEALSESLAEQLEERRKSNQSVIDLTSEQQQAELDQMREGNAAELEELAAANQAQLDAIKEKNNRIVEEQTARNEAALEQMAAQHQAELDSISESNESQLSALKDANSAKLSALRESQSEELSALKEAHSEQLEAVREANSDKLSDLKTKLGEALSELKSKLKEGTSAISDEMGNQTEVAGDKASQTTDAIEAGLAPAPDEAAEIARSIASKFVLGIDPMVLDAEAKAKSASDKTKAELDKTPKHAEDAGESTKKSFIGKLELMERDAETKSKDAAGKVASGLKSKESEVTSAATTLKDSALKPLGNLSTEYGTKGTEGGNAFVRALTQVDATSAGTQLGNGALSGMAAPDYQGAGRNAGQGFANGMSYADVYNAAYNIGMNALSAIKSALGISSPSKEMAKVGDYVGEGLIVGLTRSERDVERQGQSLADALMGELAMDSYVDDMRNDFVRSLESVRDAQSESLDAMLSDLERFGDAYVGAGAEMMRRLSSVMDPNAMLSSLETAQMSSFDRMAQSAMEAQRLMSQVRDGGIIGYATPERYIESAATTSNNVSIDVTINNPVMRDGADVREVIRQVKSEIRREAAMSIVHA